ncbi:glycosyltransferase family 4 protein [Candidatus Woesearchaeota archaeon]|nr:glycosyltransferase family 4 protein [Candidatus Woesearchaeota archaeon]
MRVLMFGWEFPPMASGGLGTACYGLTKGLKNQGAEVIFVMPRVSKDVTSSHVELISAYDTNVKRSMREKIDEIIEIDSPLTPYMSNEEYLERKNSLSSMHMSEEEIEHSRSDASNKIYGRDLYSEVWRYRQKSMLIALRKDYDIIHCHDWMTYGAGIEAKKISGKPLVVHIHATEFDRTGNNPNQYVYDLEREGFHAADIILAVSNLTRNTVIERYGVDPSKVITVHNAVEQKDSSMLEHKLPNKTKVVLFLGRITIQKGPDWFLYAAKKVLEHDPNVTFVVAGSGDMENFMMRKAAELGMSKNFLFAGFLKGDDIDRAYKMADLYVMPSISEPFGITPLESMRNGTPVLMSKQSGVSEVVRHCLKADFWDVNDMANKIISVLEHAPLHSMLVAEGAQEVKRFTWDTPAKKCVDAYEKALASCRK